MVRNRQNDSGTMSALTTPESLLAQPVSSNPYLTGASLQPPLLLIEPEPVQEPRIAPELEARQALPEPLEQQLESQVTPPVPETLADTGLQATIVEQLIFKLLYFRGDVVGRDLSTALGLKFSIIEDQIEFLKRQHLVQVKRSLGMGNSGAVFALTEAGRVLTREYLESNQYSGPEPVPLYQYTTIVRRQRRRDGWLTHDALVKAYSKMVVTRHILSQIGPAVSSGNSFLIYGQPGNGKTYLAEALDGLDDSYIYIPYAIECQGMIVQVFDPIYHHPIQEEEVESALSFEPKYDKRWIKIRRPFLVTGGELSMDMLDLNYNAVSKVYDAPYQVKANNGIYLIDDFGRPRCTPAEVLNRWIVPMERRVDYLSFQTGGKMTVPFEAFLIFSTNLRPEQLGDEAFLRRIQYKMLMRSPDAKEFAEIFERFCSSRNLPKEEGLVDRFIEKRYRATKKPLRRCHPRDVLGHVIDLINFEKLDYFLSEDLLDRAFESCFLEERDE